MSNRVKKVFTKNSSWVANAGVTSVRVLAVTPRQSAGIQKPSLIDAFGNLYMWGQNQVGQAGVGNVAAQSSPVTVLGGLNFSKEFFDASISSAFGISQGNMYGWGANSSGQLGVGDVTVRSSPVLVLGGNTYQSVVAANGSTFGLRTDGNLFAWGTNPTGNLGLGDVTPRSSPIAVLGGLTFSSVDCQGDPSTIGLTTSGAAYGWGSNTKGQLGTNDTTARSSPVAVVGGQTFVKLLMGSDSSSNSYCVGLTSAGAVYAWGSNANGQLGDGTTVAKSSPVLVLGGQVFTDIFVQKSSQAAANSAQVYALTAAGALWSWGNNTNGQLGDGTVVAKSSPVAVLGGLVFDSVRAGGTPSMVIARTTAGALYSWGGNTNGALGLGDVVPRSSPVAVLGGLTFSEFSLMPVGGGSLLMALGVSTSGNFYAWGLNTLGDLGVGDQTPRSSPVLVLGGKAANQPLTVAASIDVVPGTTYSITISQFQAFFGATMVGQGPISKLILEYED